MKTRPPRQTATGAAIHPLGRVRQRWLRSAAFSLVEVTLAIGVMGFSFVAIIGLVPVGLGNFRQTKNVSVASDISARILSELQDTPFTQLVGTTTAGQSWNLTKADGTPNGTAIRYFDEQGTETTKANSSAVYQVNICVTNAPAFLVPGAATARTPNTAVASVTIQVAYDPGNPGLAYNSAHLFSGKTNGGVTVQIFNFNTYIAKNS